MSGYPRFVSRLRTAVDTQMAFLLLALALAVIAFAGPTAHLNRDVYRFVFVFDITQSMNVSDMGPKTQPLSRLDFAKAAVRASLRRLPCGSQSGLAIFTEHRTLLLFAPVEVCENYAALSTVLENIDWQMAWAARSEVSKGLLRAIGRGTPGRRNPDSLHDRWSRGTAGPCRAPASLSGNTGPGLRRHHRHRRGHADADSQARHRR